MQRSGVEIKGFRKAWATATKKAGVPSKIPHDFTRTAVRNLVRAGVPDTIAMQITDHNTRSVFDRYNITNETDKLEELGRLSAAMGTEWDNPTQSKPSKPRKFRRRFGAPVAQWIRAADF